MASLTTHFPLAMAAFAALATPAPGIATSNRGKAEPWMANPPKLILQSRVAPYDVLLCAWASGHGRPTVVPIAGGRRLLLGGEWGRIDIFDAPTGSRVEARATWGGSGRNEAIARRCAAVPDMQVKRPAPKPHVLPGRHPG